MKRRETGENRRVVAVFPITTAISLLLVSLPGARARADEARVNPVVATAVESVVALATSCAFGLGEFESAGDEYGFLALAALHPVGTATTTWLTGRWLESDAGFGWTTLGAYAGLATGVGLDALAVVAFYPSDESWGLVFTGMAVPCVTTAAGAILGYKLSRRRPEPDESRLRLDPPSLALSLKPAKPGASPEIAGVKFNVLSVRF